MIRRVILVSLRNLLRTPVRTLLILQGVIWGTALGVFPPAIINGSMHYVQKQGEKLGTDRLLLTQEQNDVAEHFNWGLVADLRNKLGEQVGQLTGISFLQSQFPEIPLIATDAKSLAARGLAMQDGRFFRADEVDAAAQVCVLEFHAARMLFEGENPLGKSVQATTDLNLTVIGVTALRPTTDKALDEFGYTANHPLRKLVDQMKMYSGVHESEQSPLLSQDSAVMIPHTLIADAQPQWIEMRADPRQIVALRKTLQTSLTAEGYEPIIYINAILPMLFGETINTFLELNNAIFVLCICVGTSIVCVIMVLSVVERQREIAIRRVEGARRWHVALQFIVETSTLCTVGGLLGIPLGILLAILRCALEPLESVTWTFPTMESTAIVISVSAIGLLGGLLPAWRAMSVDPVEMLRYE